MQTDQYDLTGGNVSRASGTFVKLSKFPWTQRERALSSASLGPLFWRGKSCSAQCPFGGPRGRWGDPGDVVS